jgi:hypothetical protein
VNSANYAPVTFSKSDGYYYTAFCHENRSCHAEESDAAVEYDRLVLASGRQKNQPLNFQWVHP